MYENVIFFVDLQTNGSRSRMGVCWWEWYQNEDESLKFYVLHSAESVSSTNNTKTSVLSGMWMGSVFGQKLIPDPTRNQWDIDISLIDFFSLSEPTQSGPSPILESIGCELQFPGSQRSNPCFFFVLGWGMVLVQEVWAGRHDGK